MCHYASCEQKNACANNTHMKVPSTLRFPQDIQSCCQGKFSLDQVAHVKFIPHGIKANYECHSSASDSLILIDSGAIAILRLLKLLESQPMATLLSMIFVDQMCWAF